MSLGIPTTPPAIDIQELTKVYRRRGGDPLTAVNDLNLTIEAGQVFGFLGANGAGKTTTIKMICGLIKPTAGSIRVNGYNVERNRGQAMREIGAVLEGTRNVYWRLSAWENLMYFGRLKGIYGKVLKERAELLLDELDLWERRNDKIRQFSRGMQQKVAIACALIADPSVILLDEPTLGLDVKAALTVKQWIKQLALERQKTIVLTTHQLDMAQALCDRVAIINRGKLLTNRPTSQLLDLFRQEFYEIRVQGHLTAPNSNLEKSFTIQRDSNTTTLSGAINSQEELYTILDNVRALNLPLVSLTPVEPKLEEIFMDYVDKEEQYIRENGA